MKTLKEKTQLIKREYGLVWGAVLLALIIDALPLPQWGYFYWPNWTLLTVIYWILAIPHRFNIKFAWFTGLLVDFISGHWLGQNALLYTLTAYATILLHKRLRFYIPQQLLFVAVVLGLYIFVTMWAEGIRDAPDSNWNKLFSVFTGMLAWLWVYAVLRQLRRKFYYSIAHG